MKKCHMLIKVTNFQVVFDLNGVSAVALSR